jgi:Gas vesicle synthesis protein GvpL/GvpF/DnaJ domain
VEAKYIFGIIDTAEEESFRIGGVNAYEEVFAIPYKDISLVVSDSQFIDYKNLPRDHAARYLITHQQTMERLMESYTIIPMKIGTYALNFGEIDKILSKGYPLFKDVFERINNKIEIEVVAIWSDLTSIIRKIGESEDINRLKENLMSGPQGVSMEDQQEVGRLIKYALDKKRKGLASEIENELGKLSIDLRTHDLMNDMMILNTAFLIDKSQKTDFEKRLDSLNTLYNEKIHFKCIGPLPLYSFFTAEVKKMSSEEIVWARGKLGIDNRVTCDADVIKASYRRKACLYHPDRNAGNAEANRQFDEIFRAYKSLLEYIQGNGNSLSEQEYDSDDIIVKVRV